MERTCSILYFANSIFKLLHNIFYTVTLIMLSFHPNRIIFRVKQLARKQMMEPKADQFSRDARPTLLPISKSRVNGSVGI